MARPTVPLSEFIAELPEQDRLWVERRSAELIAEEYARRAARGESGAPEGAELAARDVQEEIAAYQGDAADA